MKSHDGLFPLLQDESVPDESIAVHPKKKTFSQQASVLRSLRSNFRKIKKHANNRGNKCMAVTLLSVAIFSFSIWLFSREPGDIDEITDPNMKTLYFLLTLISGAGVAVSGAASLHYCLISLYDCCNRGEPGKDEYGDAMRRDPLFSEVKSEVLAITKEVGVEIKNPDNPYQLEGALQEAQQKIEGIPSQRMAFLLGAYREKAFSYTLFKRLGSREPGTAASGIIETIFEFAGMGCGVILGRRCHKI